MDARQIELYVQRGRLRERIGVQRGQLARELAPISGALQAVDRTHAQVRQAQVWLVTHPAIVAAAVVALLVWRPRSVLSAARWSYSAWRSWVRLKHWFGLTG
jgi:hypothetical protein